MAIIYHMKEPPDRDLIEDAALERGTRPSFVEKDWFAVQLIGMVSGVANSLNASSGTKTLFGGGTCLSKAYSMIERFSEDVDFLVCGDEISRNGRREYRNSLLERIEAASSGAFKIDKESLQKGDDSRFFKVQVHYPNSFDEDFLRDTLQLEVRFYREAQQSEMRPIRSMIASMLSSDPEVEMLPCVSPIEIAANKLSALTWRVLFRAEGTQDLDPTFIRHLHDLLALVDVIRGGSENFRNLAQQAFVQDQLANRGGGVLGGKTLQDALSEAGSLLGTDDRYEADYRNYVLSMSYARDVDRINFQEAFRFFGDLSALFSQSTS